MRSILLVIFLCTGTLVFAQDQTVKGLQDESGKSITKDPNDTAAKAWKTGALFSFNCHRHRLVIGRLVAIISRCHLMGM